MICSNCQHENKAMANFCANCGARLERLCPNCGTPADPTANFCSHCGQALAQPPTPEKGRPQMGPEQVKAKPSSYMPPHLAQKILRNRQAISGERRTITVLFVDAVGSTALGELLDPEELYRLTQDALRHMMDAVHLYEGTVAQFRGDGILALFGAPIAHEDTARRAVGAALEMQRSLAEYAREVERRLGVDLRFRVGLNTGRVVVGHIGDNLEMEFTALGDTVNLGARMEAAAEPGSVYVTEDTFRATGDHFDFEPVGQIAVKGKAGPITAYKALGERSLRTRLDVAAERGLTSYVGRQHELDLLRRHLDQVKGGKGQVVLISGEAGIGKSRLLLEFRRSLQEEVTWLEGQCISYGKNIPYRPIIDIVKGAFQVEENDSEALIIHRLEEGTAGWDQATRATIPYLKALLSVDPGATAISTMDPRDRRAGILDGLRALLLQESRRLPLVVIVEDLHWVDEQSEAALRAVVDVIASAQVLLLLTFRPGYVHSMGERSYFDRLALRDLPPEQSLALAQSVLRQASLPQEITSLITGKGDGNPFFIEEVTKSLVESGMLQKRNGNYMLAQAIEGIRVPDTIQEVILSRIDRLDDQAKAALQLASVIGREFTAQLLNHISDLEAQLDEILEELKFLELIYQKAYFPEQAYMFKHALTQDVAYRTLLRERRKALHRLIGAAIEELYTDRLSEQYEILAHHYYEGKAWDQALTFLVMAGDKAAAAYANQEALDYYARALEVCELLGSSTQGTVADVTQKRGMVNLNIADHKAAIADFARLQTVAQSLKDPRLEGMALTLRAWVELEAHDPTASENSLKDALTLAGEKFEDIRLSASAIYAARLKVTNRHAEANTYYEAAKKLMPTVDDPAAQNWWWQIGPQFLIWEGRFDDALELYRHYDDAVAHSVNLRVIWFKALSLGGKGEFQHSLDLLNLLLASSERIGDTLVRVRVLNTLGWIYGEVQDYKQAMVWNREGIKAAQAAGFPNPEVESNARLNLADNLVALGRLDEAETQFRHVEQIVRSPWPEAHYMLWRYSQHHFHSYGELWLARGELDKALAYADECLALAENSKSRKNIVKGRRLRGQALMAQDQLEKAEQELSIALEIAQRIGNPTQSWLTYVAFGDLRTSQERPDEAQKSYREAIEVIQQIAAGLDDWEQRETFLNSAAVRSIMAKSEL